MDSESTQLTVGGADAASFQIVGSGLYLKAGTVLNSNTKPTYNVTVNVDDTTVGATPDASANFTLNLTQVAGGGSAIKSPKSLHGAAATARRRRRLVRGDQHRIHRRGHHRLENVRQRIRRVRRSAR